VCSSDLCPVGIDTGDLTRRLRGRKLGDTARSLHQWTGENFGTFSSLSRTGLKVGHAVSDILGDNFVNRVTGGAWRKSMPPAAKAPTLRTAQGDPVVYFPTCGARIFGPADSADKQLGDVVQELLIRAGYAPILPEGFDKLCCGQMLASKGMLEEAEDMSNTLEAALLKASDNGRIPVIMDASACSFRMQKHLEAKTGSQLKIYDFHEFAHDALLPRLMITKQSGPVALHVNCSVKRSGADNKLRTLLKACAEQVIEPSAVTCCGFGGDRGFAVPELNQHALRHIHDDLPANCACGVSTNRTCEIGLTAETGRTYRSVAYLLEACSRKEDNMTC
jgi:D-lactate dehydrogenase